MAKPSSAVHEAHELSRRHFLWLTSLSAAGWVAGCATSPVTGKPQLMLVSEEEEIQVDKQYSPLQFSSDYGTVRDKALREYVSDVGKDISSRTHRPKMPYSFWVVNATYVNAYAFPGGSIACTRGILLDLDNEAQLAALLGHELGHVNARHTAQQMSKGSITQVFVGGLSVLAGVAGGGLGQVAAQLGTIGAGALLASYSRDNEREADALGMEYMVKAGYDPKGMVGLMDMLRSLNKNKPSAIELMFSTHPMSDERYATAVKRVKEDYPKAASLPVYRERYMDNTERLRAQKDAIEEMQKGEQLMANKKFTEAERHFKKALNEAPEDYAGLVMMATCQLVQKDYREGLRYAEEAQSVYPREAQAHHLSGFAKIQTKDYEGAYEEFSTCEKLLPANPNSIFFKGYALEGMRKREEAAKEYTRYLKIVQEGQYAQHAYKRLVEWGYVKK
jgi:predicted Zn-dependent protease